MCSCTVCLFLCVNACVKLLAYSYCSVCACLVADKFTCVSEYQANEVGASQLAEACTYV